MLRFVIFIVLALAATWVLHAAEPAPEPTPQPVTYLTTASADLNGDGKAETITFTCDNDRRLRHYGEYTLRINGQHVRGKLEPEIAGFRIIDIDTKDAIKEVAVHTYGPSDDDEDVVYWYDGQRIRQVAHLARWADYPGTGIVYVRDWMGFWATTDRYILRKSTHTLEETPQSLYYVGVEAKVTESFPILTTQRGVVLANLRKGSTATVILWDPMTKQPDAKYGDEWYLIKSETGLLGWAQLKTMKMELPIAD